LVDQRGALSDGSVAKDDQGAHAHWILKRARKQGSSDLQGKEDGNCGLQKIEVEKLRNGQSIALLTTDTNTHPSYRRKRLAVVDGRS
jgi:hypothetical protein